MSVVRWATEPARGPVRRVVTHYHRMVEDLIHAAKNELVGRLDEVEERLDETEELINRRHDLLADQLAVQAAALRGIEAELARIRDVIPDPQAGRQPAAQPEPLPADG